MTTAVLKAAEAALSMHEAVSDGAEETSGDLNGRSVTHWSYKLFIAGTIIGAIAAVASFILGLTAIAVIGALLAITNGFAAFYVKRLGTLKTLEGYTERLAEKVQELKGVNDGLDDVTDGLQKVPDDWRKEIQKGEEAIGKKAKELEEIAGKLQVAEAKLQKLAGVTKDIQKGTGEMSAEVVKFCQENNLFGERVDRLEKEAKRAEERNENLEELIMRTDANTDEYEALIQQLANQVHMVEDLFALMKELYVKAQDEMAELKSQVTKLDLVVSQAGKSAQKAQEASAQLEKQRKDYENLLKKLNDALEKVERYRKYKKAYVLLLKLKKSDMWPEIERRFLRSKK